MKSIFIYLCKGTYTGNPEFDYNHPEVSENYKYLLFLYQETLEVSMALAESESAKFGFTSIKIDNGKQLSVESLNTDEYRKFTDYYEEAMEEGSALAWYSNA